MTLFDDARPTKAPVRASRDAKEAQSRASKQGQEFEEKVRLELIFKGWNITAQKYRIANGAEVDIVAIDPDGIEWWIECKGSYDVPRTAGIRRSDTIKKAIGTAVMVADIPDHPPYMLVTSHQPNAGSLSEAHVSVALKWGLFEKVVTPDEL